METKICPKCGKELPVSEFSKNSKAKDGLQSQCKSCQSAAHKEKQERVKKLLGGEKKRSFRVHFQGVDARASQKGLQRHP